MLSPETATGRAFLSDENLDRFIVGDARELKALVGRAECVDAIITSPPYLDLKDYGHGTQIGFGQSAEQYYDVLEDVFRQALTVTRDTGAFWLVADTIRSDRELRPIPWLLLVRAVRVGWSLQETIVWDKGKGNPYSHHGRLRNIFEYVILLTKKREGFKWRARRISELHRPQSPYFIGWPERHSPFGRNPGNVWRFPLTVQGVWSPSVRAGNTTRRHLHDCPFPFGLVERLIDLTTDPGDVVLDMFAGSGSVPAVADAMDRRWIAIEINPEFNRMFEEETLRAATQEYEAGYWRRKLHARELADEGGLNLKLRHLKFLRELTRHTTASLRGKSSAHREPTIRAVVGVCRTDLRAVVESRDYYHLPDGKPLIEMDVYFVLSDSRQADRIRTIANDLATKRPLSKYSIEATIHAHEINEIDLHTLALAPDESLYLYNGLRTHRYAKIVTARAWKTGLGRKQRATPALLANNAILLASRSNRSVLDMSATVSKRRVMRYALKRHRHNLEQAAAALGVSLYSLVKEIHALGISLPPTAPEEQRGLLSAVKWINPAVRESGEEYVAALDDAGEEDE